MPQCTGQLHAHSCSNVARDGRGDQRACWSAGPGTGWRLRDYEPSPALALREMQVQTGASLGRAPPAHSLRAFEDAAAGGLAPLRMPVLQPAAPSPDPPQEPRASGADHRDGGDGARADPNGVDAADRGDVGGVSIWTDGDDGGGGGGGWSDGDDYGGGGGWSDREQEDELQEAAPADPGTDPGSDPGSDPDSDGDEDQENRASQGNQGAAQPRAAPAANGGTSRGTGRSALCDGAPGSVVMGTRSAHSGAVGESSHGAPGTAAAAAKEDPAKRRVKRGHAQRNSLTGARRLEGVNKEGFVPK